MEWTLTSVIYSSFLRSRHEGDQIYLALPSFCNAIRDELTAKDSSMGSSGGTTEVNIRVHSKNSL